MLSPNTNWRCSSASVRTVTLENFVKKVSLNHLMQDSPLRCMSVKYLQIFLEFILWLKQPLQNFIHVFFPTPGHSSSDGTK